MLFSTGAVRDSVQIERNPHWVGAYYILYYLDYVEVGAKNVSGDDTRLHSREVVY